MTPDTPTLGQLLRGARSGFYYSAALGCFLRLRKGAGANWEAMLSDVQALPERPDPNTYIHWADGGALTKAIEKAPGLVRHAAEFAGRFCSVRTVELCEHGEWLGAACDGCKRVGLAQS